MGVSKPLVAILQKQAETKGHFFSDFLEAVSAFGFLLSLDSELDSDLVDSDFSPPELEDPADFLA